MDVKTTPRLSMSVEKGNLFGALLGLPPSAAALGLFAAAWGKEGVRHALDQLSGMGFWPVMGTVVGLIVAHELVHGLTWMLASGSPWSALRFGVMWRMLTPYCHVTRPIPARAYRLGAVMPLILLGLVPTAVAVATGWGLIMPAALTMIFGAGGDLLAVWLLRGVPGDTRVEDHPTEVGCRLAEPASAAA